MELNFFDTAYNMSLNIFLLGEKLFLIFLCIEVGEHDAETVVTVVVATIVVEVEHACIGSIAVIATTNEERIARVREVRVVV